MKNLVLLLCILVSFSVCYAQNGVIKGQIIPEIPSEKLQILKKTKVILTLNETEFIAQLDNELKFEFKHLKPGHFKLYIEPRSPQYNFTYKGSIEANKTLEMGIPYSINCKYDLSKNEKRCPVCKKKDKVIPIYYGLLIDTKNEEGKKYKSGGCTTTGCDPNWYCKRDNNEF